MKTVMNILLMLILLATFSTVIGQEEKKDDGPKWLVFSQNMVPMKYVSNVNKMSDSIFVPILKELANEGLLFSFGQLNHAWGDEWNVNFYYITQDQDSFNKFWKEYIKRIRDKHPNSFQDIIKYFTAHKDNMYSIQNMYDAPPKK